MNRYRVYCTIDIAIELVSPNEIQAKRDCDFIANGILVGRIENAVLPTSSGKVKVLKIEQAEGAEVVK